MATSGYPPKGPRNVMKNFSRPPRSGAQTWGPNSSVPNSHNHQASYRPITAQSVFNPPPPTKHDFSPVYLNNGYTSPCGTFDSPPSPPSSDGSVEGSPPRFNHGMAHPYDLMPEEALSTLSSPGDDSHDSKYYESEYFDLGQRAETPMEHGRSASVSHFPPGMHHGYDNRAQYSPQNRSRQGSTGYAGAQQMDQRIQSKGDEPISPTSSIRRSQKPQKNGNVGRRGGNGQSKPDQSFYTIQFADDSWDLDEDDIDEGLPEMVTSLNARAQFAICKEVDEVLRNALFWWLCFYKFNIMRNPKARDIETADDRDYDGFSAIINDLTAKRQVPREAVHHERIAELNTVLAGPSEIRHMLAHPERHLKSDWRMLGLIAASIEVCKILCYSKGHRQLFKLYQKIDRQISIKKMEKVMQEMGIDVTKLGTQALEAVFSDKLVIKSEPPKYPGQETSAQKVERKFK